MPFAFIESELEKCGTAIVYCISCRNFQTIAFKILQFENLNQRIWLRGAKGDTFAHHLSPDYCVTFDLRHVEISGTGFCLNLKLDVRPWNCIFE